MISKAYSIFCDECTKYTNLFGQTIKDCEDEARNMAWTKEPGKGGKHWYCPECSAEMAHKAANGPDNA